VLVRQIQSHHLTDPDWRCNSIEPIPPEIVAKIIEKERATDPRASGALPTMGGKTALNCACRFASRAVEAVRTSR